MFANAHQRLEDLGRHAREAHQTVGLQAVKYTLITFLVAYGAFELGKSAVKVGTELDAVFQEQMDYLAHIEDAVGRVTSAVVAIHDEEYNEKVALLGAFDKDPQKLTNVKAIHKAITAHIHGFVEDHVHEHDQHTPGHYVNIACAICVLTIIEIVVAAFLVFVVLENFVAVLSFSVITSVYNLVSFFLHDVRAPEEVLLLIVAFLGCCYAVALKHGAEHQRRASLSEDDAV